jgi:hypothetical protein
MISADYNKGWIFSAACAEAVHDSVRNKLPRHFNDQIHISSPQCSC